MSYDSIRPAVGASLAAGKAYHDIPGVDGPTYRTSSQARADQIAQYIDVDGKVGLDLGCSLGGVSFGLVNHGATMYGYDHDETAIDIANGHAIKNELSARFGIADLASPDGWQNAIMPREYDFAVWLANWMWVAKAAGVDEAKSRLRQLSERAKVLAFETAQGNGGSMAGTFGMHDNDDVLDLLTEHTTYTDIRCVGPVVDKWHQRSLFIARRA